MSKLQKAEVCYVTRFDRFLHIQQNITSALMLEFGGLKFVSKVSGVLVYSGETGSTQVLLLLFMGMNTMNVFKDRMCTALSPFIMWPFGTGDPSYELLCFKYNPAISSFYKSKDTVSFLTWNK